MAVLRTQYWNLGAGTVRGGGTGHGESLTDLERYLMPVDRLRTSALHPFGVADGLGVRVSVGTAGIAVSVGMAIDGAGNVIAVVDLGVAVTDPTVDPTVVQNVPTVPVGTDGVMIDTTVNGTATGDTLLTVTWREVEGTGTLANTPVLLHAPWLRLVPAAGFVDAGDQVVLAAVSLDSAGLITALAAGPRRASSAVAGSLRLRVPAVEDTVAPARAVDDGEVAELAARPEGGVRLDLLGASARTALTVDAAGKLGIGVGQAQRTVHVEGDEVHSGGAGGGFSFANRTGSGFVETPTTGERWVWYASDGTARLWSGTDRLTIGVAGEGGGLDVARRMRVRQGDDASAGLWLHQSGPDADRAFVGMANDNTVGFYGIGSGWQLTVDVGTGRTTAASGLVANGVTVGTDATGAAIDYPFEYETVGVNQANFNLRLQSPNSVIVHTNGAQRAGFSAGGLDVTGFLSLHGRLTLQADDPWLRLNQANHYPNGVHTPYALSCGNLNVGGVGNWGNPGPGNAVIAGTLIVQGETRLGAADQPVYIGGNQTGPFMALHDDLWFSDPQNGIIEIKDATQVGWGKLKGQFLSPSSRSYKQAITPLGDPDRDSLLAEALAAELVWFRWRPDDGSGRRRLGVIAEDAPVHFVEEDRTSLSLPEYVAVLLGAVQVLHSQVTELRAQVVTA